MRKPDSPFWVEGWFLVPQTNWLGPHPRPANREAPRAALDKNSSRLAERDGYYLSFYRHFACTSSTQLIAAATLGNPIVLTNRTMA